MALLTTILGIAPRWARQLPRGLRPSWSEVLRIEAIRVRHRFRHDELAVHMMSHPWTTRRVLRLGERRLRQSTPELDQSSIYATLLKDRLEVGPFVSLLGLDRSGSVADALHAVARFRHIDEFADAITREELKKSPGLDWAPGFSTFREFEQIGAIYDIADILGVQLPEPHETNADDAEH